MLFRSPVLTNKQFKELAEKKIDFLQYILQYEKFPEYKNLTHNIVSIFCWDEKPELNPTNSIKAILKKLNKYSYDGIMELINNDKTQAAIKVNNSFLYKTQDLAQKIQNINNSFLCLCYDMQFSLDQSEQLMNAIFKKLSLSYNTIFDIAKILCGKNAEKVSFATSNNYNNLLKIAACFKEFKLTNFIDNAPSLNVFFSEYNNIHDHQGKKQLYSEERLRQMVINYEIKIEESELEESIIKIYPTNAIDWFIKFIDNFLLNSDEIASDYSFVSYLPKYKEDIAKDKLLPFINQKYKEMSGSYEDFLFINDLQKTKGKFLRLPIHFFTSPEHLNNFCLFESYIKKNKIFILNSLKEFIFIITLKLQLVTAVYNDNMFPELNNKEFIKHYYSYILNYARSIFLIYCHIAENNNELNDCMSVFAKELLFHFESNGRKNDFIRLVTLNKNIAMFRYDLNSIVIEKNVVSRRLIGKKYTRLLKI